MLAILFEGTLIVQAYNYYENFPYDKLRTKITVCIIPVEVENYLLRRRFGIRWDWYGELIPSRSSAMFSTDDMMAQRNRHRSYHPNMQSDV